MNTTRRILARGLAVAMVLGPVLESLAAAQGRAQSPTLVLAPALTQDEAAAQAGGAAPAAKPFKEEELASLLAPVALYPDPVITQILMASTYPLEVVEASRWLEKNKDLKGDALQKELEGKSWDDSVKALVAIPDVLKKMDENLDWTQKVGDAVLAQQADVMASIQILRNKAYKQGNLKSDDHLNVKVEPTAPAPASTTTTVVVPPTQTIVIQPSNPQVVYVPTYDPVVVYGTWLYPAYPPYPYYPPGYAFAAGVAWGVGVAVTVGVWNNVWHGSNCNWHGGDITVNRNVNIDNSTNINRGNNAQVNPQGAGAGRGQAQAGAWQHNPEHRKGVSYRDQGTAQKYNRAAPAGASSREAYRGRSAQAGQQPTAGAGNAGRNTSGGTPKAGTMDANRGGSAGTKPGTMDANRGGGGSRPSPGASAAPSTGGGSSGGALSGMGSSGGQAKASSARGSSSRSFQGGRGGGRRR